MKNVLLGGLRSLIPHRDVEDADEVLERLDNEANEAEEVEEEKEQPVKVVKASVKKSKKPKVVKAQEPEPEPEEDVVEEETAAEQEEVPKKPLVTPLTFDDKAKVKKKKQAVKAKQKTKKTEGEDKDNAWDRHEGNVEHVAVMSITVNPNQPRRQFDKVDMAELTDSIDQHGILQPLVVRRTEDGAYELIAGERRLRAATSLGWEKVPCVVRRGVTTQVSHLELALVENIQRQDLNPVEEALAYKELNEEYGMTHEEIGKRVGRSRVGITNSIRVLQLPDEVQKGIIDGRISLGHAKAILMVPDSEKQVRFYRHMVEEGLTVRKSETRARRIQRTMNLDEPMRTKRKGRNAFEIKYSGILEDRYGFDSKVKFKDAENRFEVVFRCFSAEDIEELIGRLMGKRELPEHIDADVIEAAED